MYFSKQFYSITNPLKNVKHASIGRKKNVKQYTSKNTCNGNGSGGPRPLPMDGGGGEKLCRNPKIGLNPRVLDQRSKIENI